MTRDSAVAAVWGCGVGAESGTGRSVEKEQMEPYVAERNGLDLVVGKQREENKRRAEPGRAGLNSPRGTEWPEKRTGTCTPRSAKTGLQLRKEKEGQVCVLWP